MKQFGHYIQAVGAYVKKGLKNRTDEEVKALLVVCQSCTEYDAEHQRCTICGCRCTAGKVAFLNKLRMPDEHCPQNRW